MADNYKPIFGWQRRRYVVAAGIPFDGIQLYGFFDDPEAANDHGDREMGGLDWWVVGVNPVGDLWDDDLIQFARLLSEIQGAWSINEGQWQALRESMDLQNDDLMALFDRAFNVWDAAKARVSGIPEGQS